MSIASAWPFFAINLICFGLAWIAAAHSGFYRRLVYQPAAGRTEMIDGLRGWLALGVFFTHVVAMYSYQLTGKWSSALAPFYALTGHVGVSLFFVITGFLFWTKVLRADGALNAGSLYRSRILRLTPMYLVSVLAVMAVVAALSGFSLRTDPMSLLRELRSWLSFGFMYAGDINGVKDAHRINAVYWTLAYEWMFYLALPFLAVFRRYPAWLALFAAAFFFGTQAPITLNFISGAAAAMIVHHRLLPAGLEARWLTPLPLAALAAVFLMPSLPPVVHVVLMFVFFLFVAHGNSLFGLLATGAAKVLGAVSYSIYLLHCIVLFVVVTLVDAHTPIAQLPVERYWMFAALAGAATVLLSLVTYRHVEHPFIAGRQRPARTASAQTLAGGLARPAAGD